VRKLDADYNSGVATGYLLHYVGSSSQKCCCSLFLQAFFQFSGLDVGLGSNVFLYITEFVLCVTRCLFCKQFLTMAVVAGSLL